MNILFKGGYACTLQLAMKNKVLGFQFISCFFRVTNLSAILLLYCDAFFFFFASPWQGEPTASGVSGFFFFSYFSAGLSGNGVHSLASSLMLASSQHCISFNINISWFLLLWQVNIYYVIFIKHCCMYMILSWLRLGSGGPCLYVFSQTKVQGSKNGKTKKKVLGFLCPHNPVT